MHRRSPSKLAESRRLVLEGLVCRESNVASQLVNKRWMQLYGASLNEEPPLLLSFRHRDDAEPTKVWPVTKSCSVTDVAEGIFHLRIDTSTLVAMVAAKYTEVKMVSRARGGVCSSRV